MWDSPLWVSPITLIISLLLLYGCCCGTLSCIAIHLNRVDEDEQVDEDEDEQIDEQVEVEGQVEGQVSVWVV